MGFNIYTSNNIEELSKEFCKSIKTKDKWTDATHIIVQTKGIEKWLIDEVTSENSIFANYQFSNLDGFTSKLYQLAGAYFSSYFSVESLKWMLFQIMNGDDFKSQFPLIHRYYDGDDVKRIQLASKTADLFDQYLTYRPNYIKAWNKGEDALTKTNNNEDFKKHEEWQKWLWKRIKSDSNGEYDKLQQKDKLTEQLNSEEFKQKVKNLFPRVSLFAIAVISNYHMEIYQKLSEVIDVDLYITTPSNSENWYNKEYNDDENELLSSCKSLSKNMLSSIDANICSLHNKSIEPEATSLLSTIQSDVYTNSNKAIKRYKTNTADTSVHIVSSYTPVREIEALYNHLLNEFENNLALKTSDVSVQVTDINLYAPLIKAVFDNAPKKIPYQITDLAYSDGDSIIRALELFTELPFSNYKAENVMQLLEFKAVRDRFDITDIDEIRNIIADANIRYGIEGRKEDDTYLFSWKHGLTKLLLGYAIKGGNIFTIDNTEYFPCDTVEGTNALNSFKIKAFAETIFKLQKDALNKRTVIEWKQFLLNDIIDSLFTTDDSYADELEYIYKKLENVEFIAQNIDEKILFKVFAQGLFAMLSSDTKNSNYTSGRVTFSSIIPIRSIPFKHIAILGLNSGVFPRQQNSVGFNLIAIDPQENDRNTKDNDKYLFLEAILSSRKQLYLSYIGSSINDNSELPPSLLIEELEEYITTGTANLKWFNNSVKYKHPLHSTGKKYFENGRLFTYLGKPDKVSTDNAVSLSIPKLDINFDEIDIDDLIRFYKDPFKWYYNKTLKVYYTDNDVLLPEEEPFSLDSLQQWAIKSELVGLIASKEKEYIKKKKHFGLIPLANMANIEVKTQNQAVNDIKRRFNSLVSGNSHSEPILIEFRNKMPEDNSISTLKGKIKSIYKEGNINVNVSGRFSQYRYLLEAWIKHLALVACNKNLDTIFISSTYQFQIKSDFIDSIEAKHILLQLIDIYKKGHTHIIPFMPKDGYLLINNINKGVEEDISMSKLIKGIKDDKYRSEYVAKEDSYGLFNLLLSDAELLNSNDEKLVKDKKDTVLKISKLLFDKITLIAQ